MPYAKWQFATEKKETRKFDDTKGWLWAIPLTEIQNNPNLKQNPGY
ncbi:RagB/SusD family nutrient uptake outer membrane protein [Hallella multisaccharivorax]